MVSDRLLREFEKAADFMVAKKKSGEWQKTSSNFLREWVRCVSGQGYSNTKSPEILRALLRKRPDLKPYIPLGTRKGEAPPLFNRDGEKQRWHDEL